MLYWLSQFSSQFSFFNLFRYITFRSMGALITGFCLVFLWMPSFIAWMRKQGEHPIRLDGPAQHLVTKKGTPSMGGALMGVAFMVALLCWADLGNQYVWISSFVFLGLGFLGAVDDRLKVTRKNPKGVSGKAKIFYQIVIACIALTALWMVEPDTLKGTVFFPFLKHLTLPLGYFYFFWGIGVIVGASNAVNLTDGLDGLAIGPVMISCMVFACMAYVIGHAGFAQYLQFPFIPQAGELMVPCCALVGAGLGFLWYNAPPATIMMGDVGALALGGFLGIISLMIKQELLLVLVGGVFVIEALSVMMQVLIYKKTGQRLFLMAPIHHHFEKKGWSESTVVIRFWIISALLGLLALSSLKLR